MSPVLVDTCMHETGVSMGVACFFLKITTVAFFSFFLGRLEYEYSQTSRPRRSCFSSLPSTCVLLIAAIPRVGARVASMMPGQVYLGSNPTNDVDQHLLSSRANVVDQCHEVSHCHRFFTFLPPSLPFFSSVSISFEIQLL